MNLKVDCMFIKKDTSLVSPAGLTVFVLCASETETLSNYLYFNEFHLVFKYYFCGLVSMQSKVFLKSVLQVK